MKTMNKVDNSIIEMISELEGLLIEVIHDELSDMSKLSSHFFKLFERLIPDLEKNGVDTSNLLWIKRILDVYKTER